MLELMQSIRLKIKIDSVTSVAELDVHQDPVE